MVALHNNHNLNTTFCIIITIIYSYLTFNAKVFNRVYKLFWQTTVLKDDPTIFQPRTMSLHLNEWWG